MNAATRSPLVVVRAPAGFGKTVAIVDWLASLRERDTTTVWVTLTADARGRRQFWTRIIAALSDGRVISPTGLLSNLVLTGDTIRDSEILPVLGRGFAEITGQTRLVIDDFHLVDSDTVATDLVWLLEQTPRLSAVIATRTRSDLESLDSQSRLDSVTVGTAELRFSPAETHAVAVATGDHGGDTAERLHDATAGWPLATRVLIRFLATSPPGAVPATTSGLDLVAAERHLAEMAVSGRDAQTARFVLLTSFTETLTIELATELSGVPPDTVGTILDELSDDGFGQWQENDGALVFRYHPLLRSGFERLAESVVPDDVAPARRRLALALANGKPGGIVAALEQCVAIADWDLLAEIYLSSPSTTFSDAERLIVVLQAVPRPTLRKHPLLLVALIICTYAFRLDSRDRLLTGFDTALVLAQGKLADRTTAEGVFWSTAVMAANRLTGRSAKALKVATTLVPESSESTAPETVAQLTRHPFIYNQVGITLMYSARYNRAISAFQTARDLPPNRVDGLDASHGIALSAAASALRGRMDSARGLIATAESIERPHGWLGSYFGAGYQIAAMLSDLERFDAGSAELRLRAIDEDMASNIEHWPYLVRIEGLIALTRGGGREGVLAFTAERDNVRKRPRTTPQLLALLAATEADLLMTAGQLPLAATVLGKWRGKELGQPDLSAARLAILRARPDEALTILASLAWSDQERVRAEAALLSAVALSDLDQTATAGTAVAEAATAALDLITGLGLGQPLMMIPRARLQPVLALALGEDGAAAILADVPDPFGRLPGIAQLTRRELVVLRELATTSESLEIADRLSVSRHTVKVQLKSTYRKLGASSRAEALSVAYQHGLLTRASEAGGAPRIEPQLEH